MMRLDRFLANNRMGTRSQVKKMVKQGRVCVNHQVVKDDALKIDEACDHITIDGQVVVFQKYVYYMLHKPKGYISATSSHHVPTVLDLIHEADKGLFPCGRLDKDTEGLLLITNDGPLAHELLSPKKHVEKEYYVEHTLPLTPQDIEQIEQGICFQGIQYQPATYIPKSETSCHLIIHEGKYHEIKKIFQAVGDHVTYLKRLRMKNLILDPSLKPGEYRPLTSQEIADLQQ